MKNSAAFLGAAAFLATLLQPLTGEARETVSFNGY